MITKEQLNAALGILRWSSKDLAEKTELGVATIQRARTGTGNVSGANMKLIEMVLTQQGIEFHDGGWVRLK